MPNICQSCGLPVTVKMKYGGTNADGSESTKYCGYCYENGEFIYPDITAKEMQDYCMVILSSLGIQKPLCWLFSRNISKLERWK